MMKKKWEKPELIILVRNQPEESVLNSCKTGWYGIQGADMTYDMCVDFMSSVKCNTLANS